jgi:hypothetical protein
VTSTRINLFLSAVLNQSAIVVPVTKRTALVKASTAAQAQARSRETEMLMLSISLGNDGIGQELANIRGEPESDLEE